MPPLTLYQRESPDDWPTAVAALVAKGYSEAEAVALVAKQYPHLVRISKSTQQEHTMAAYDVIKNLAEERVRKGEARTIEQGIDQVVCERPELYDRYTQEERPTAPSAPVSQPRKFDKSAAMYSLEAIANRYLVEKRVKTFQLGFDLAVQERPDLFAEALRQEARRTV